jgi:hypothetical protein
MSAKDTEFTGILKPLFGHPLRDLCVSVVNFGWLFRFFRVYSQLARHSPASAGRRLVHSRLLSLRLERLPQAFAVRNARSFALSVAFAASIESRRSAFCFGPTIGNVGNGWLIR